MRARFLDDISTGRRGQARGYICSPSHVLVGRVFGDNGGIVSGRLAGPASERRLTSSAWLGPELACANPQLASL